MEKDRIKAVIALLSAADSLMVQAETAGKNDRYLLAATTKARMHLNKECDRLIKIHDVKTKLYGESR